MPVNDNVEYNNLPTATEQRGMYSPPNGNHPQTLPDLWRDGNDIVRDDLPSLTDEQLNDLGWKGPIQMPPLSGTSFFTHTYEWNSETREWASFELSILDKEKNVEYEKFWDLFIDTDFYNRLKTTASTKLATNVLYTEFIALLDDAKRGHANTTKIQTAFTEIIDDVTFTADEIAKLQGILESTGMSVFYSLS